MKHYVIVGNGIAAAGCIEGIRSIDSISDITVISEEKYPVYCRPLISYYLQGKTNLENIGYRPSDFYEQMHCHLLLGKKAVHIHPDTHQLNLDDGSVIPYTNLCIAAGSTSFIPSFDGLESVEKKYTFLSLDDTLSLEEGIHPESRVLIIGAGLIGLKCAEGLFGRVKEIAVCDLADRVLSSILDQDASALMQQHLENHGIRFYLNDSVSRFEKEIAHMKSGKGVPFDVLVLAVGVRANTSLLREIDGEVNRGIVINNRMQTSISDIYAAGDCTEGFDLSAGQNRVLALLPNAYMQGYNAGVNMAGVSTIFNKAIPMNSIGFFGLHVMTAGTYDGDVYEEKTDHSLKRLFTKDGLLKGFILIGCDERAGIYTSMIREQIPLSSVNFELMKKGATTAAFPKAYRRKNFGGVV